jgi:predicted urease superfamily metal-dependent hydrolase
MNTQLPKTDSIKELAHFWDNHDITDYEELLEEVIEPVFNRGTDIQIHLKKEEIESLEKIAKQSGKRHNELVKEWIIEKLKVA